MKPGSTSYESTRTWREGIMEATGRLDRLIPWLMTATVLAVATFAFTQSYTHTYDLGQAHHQAGASLRMLPLSVDWLMFAAGLVMLHLGRKGIRHPLPRAALALGATATLVANVASGIIWGWESALIAAWAPVVLFTAVELGMLLVRTIAKAKPELSEANPVAGPSIETMQRILANLPAEKSPRPQMPTQLRRPEVRYDPSGDTASIPVVPEVTGSPQENLAGWGQLGGQGEPAGQAARQEAGGLTGIGLSNGRK